MKKYLKNIFAVALVFGMAIALIGCGDKDDNTSDSKENNTSNETSKSESTGSKSWPTEISYVPNIAYEGKGKIVNTEEEVSDYGDTSYSIYIDGADLESVNQYVDKLYSNGYSVLYSFASEGQYLKQPEKDNFYTMQYVNTDTGFRTDATIIVGITLYDNEEGYNLAITFGDLSSFNE